MSRIGHTLRHLNLPPPIHLSIPLINKNRLIIARAHNNSPILASIRRPRYVRRGGWNGTVWGLDWKSDFVQKGEGRVADAIVGWEEIVGIGAGGSATVLVRHHVAAVGDAGHGRHAGARGVGRVVYVVDCWVPGFQVGGGLVDKLLAVERTTLVGIVDG